MRSPGSSFRTRISVTLFLAAIGCGGGGGSLSDPDRKPPSFAGVQAAIPIDDTAAILQWNAANDDRDAAAVLVYNVYTATASGAQDFTAPIVTSGLGELQITLTGLTPATTYFFVVRAEDTRGNEEKNTTELSATTLALPDTTPPSFGGAVTATAISSSAIDVTWNPATDVNTPQSLIVYNAYAATASMGQSFGTPTATSPAGATSLTLAGLLDTTPYFIVVRAVDAVGNEDPNTIEVTDTTFMPDLTPPTFAGLQTATPNNPVKVDLAWNAASDNQSSPAQIIYKVYMATTSGGQNFGSPSFVTGPGALSHTMGGLSPNTDYFFVVRAQDFEGNEDTNTVERSARTLVSFGANVLQIFTSNCAVSNCHGSSNPVLGQDLTSYSSITNTVINFPAQQPMIPMDRIEPGDSTRSYLQHKIDGTHTTGGVLGSGDQMPKNNPPLPAASRDLIRTWIDQGALGN